MSRGPDPIHKDQCPATLPEKPTGWRRQLELHMSMDGGGIGIYNVVDDQGRMMPIQQQYDSRKPKPAGPRGAKAVVPGPSGFAIRDATQPAGFWGEVAPSWSLLREHWAAWMAGLPNPRIEE